MLRLCREDLAASLSMTTVNVTRGCAFCVGLGITAAISLVILSEHERPRVRVEESLPCPTLPEHRKASPKFRFGNRQSDSQKFPSITAGGSVQ
jgi:hypothetical protein